MCVIEMLSCTCKRETSVKTAEERRARQPGRGGASDASVTLFDTDFVKKFNAPEVLLLSRGANRGDNHQSFSLMDFLPPLYFTSMLSCSERATWKTRSLGMPS